VQNSGPNFFNPDKIELTGIVTNGVLRLDQAGMSPGDPVSGTFTGEIIPFPPEWFGGLLLKVYCSED
jgi:hypothetical protein